jgi:hypothetical protein
MSMTNGVVGSLIGGAIGALTWMGVALATEREIGWIAWGIGALAGLGMSLGLKGLGDPKAGVVAALIALVSVFAGKYAAVHFAVQRSLDEVESSPIEDRHIQLHLADEVVKAWEAEGRELQWPPGMTLQRAEKPKDYPEGVWEEAVAQFDAQSPADRTQLTKELAEKRSRMLRGMQSQFAIEGFKESLGAYDLLWAGLAVATAYRLGSRRKETAPMAPVV